MAGLSALLQPDFHVVGKSISLAAAAEMLRATPASLAIIDRAFGIHAVCSWLVSLRESHQATVVIVWGAGISDTEMPHLVQAGARGIIRKTADVDTVISCVRTVAAGHPWVQRSAVRKQSPPWRPYCSKLTGRELQVLELIEQGMRNKDIAGALGIETGTVKIHLRHIFEKTGIHGRLELALAGLKEKAVLSLPTM